MLLKGERAWWIISGDVRRFKMRNDDGWVLFPVEQKEVLPPLETFSNDLN
ncbi:MAG: hypothetical protein GY822_25730 [Deltaproteobacteria bacterium]|nr:hypothetical protein [Deltaproteobacteria bacterium]